MKSYLEYQGFRLIIESEVAPANGNILLLNQSKGSTFGHVRKSRRGVKLSQVQYQELIKFKGETKEDLNPIDITIDGVSELFWIPKVVEIKSLPAYLVCKQTSQVFEVGELLTDTNIPVLDCYIVPVVIATEI